MSPRGVVWLDRHLPPSVRRVLAWVHDFWITALVLLACGLLVYTAVKQHETATQSHNTAVQARATAIQAAKLAQENRSLLLEVQRSRVESCQRTYEGVREIFRPFFPPLKQATPKQRRDRRKFNRRVNQLKAHCPAQTHASGR